MPLPLLVSIAILDLLCLGICVMIFIELFCFFVSDYLDVPFVPTPRRLFPRIFDALAVDKGDVVVELGSGDARFLAYTARRQPLARYIGVERNPLLYLQARLRRRLRGRSQNLTLKHGDLFKEDLSGATKIYAYLLPEVMDRLLPALERDFHGTLASRAFRFQNKAHAAVVELSKRPGNHGQHLLYIYEF